MNFDDFKLQDDDPDTLNILYIMYLASFVMLGIPALIAFAIAYTYRKRGGTWLNSHYIYLMDTFWRGLLYFVVSLLTLPLLIGLFLLPATLIWWIVRCVKGLQNLGKSLPIENPKRWTF